MRTSYVVRESLNKKQFQQLISIAKETQSYLPFSEVAFMELVKIVKRYCTSSYYNEGFLSGGKNLFKEHLVKFGMKYYPYGFKQNGKNLLPQHYEIIQEFKVPNFSGKFAYNAIEKVCFVKAVRLCRDYIKNGMTNEAADLLIRGLDVLKVCLN